jgi:hypothetical protein
VAYLWHLLGYALERLFGMQWRMSEAVYREILDVIDAEGGE